MSSGKLVILPCVALLHQLMSWSRLSSDIVCFVLRNSPLRIVRVSRVISDSEELVMPRWAQSMPAQGPSIVTLDMVQYSPEGPHLTQDRLLSIPDDQIILFWTEVAHFILSGPVEEENTTYSEKHHWHYFEIRDQWGKVVGKTDYCDPGDANDDLVRWTGTQDSFDFVQIGTNAAPQAAVEKVVLLVFWEHDIAYRISVGDIQEDAWKRSNPRRRLVAMG